MCIRDRSREDICEWRKELNEMREESLQEEVNKNTQEQIINNNNNNNRTEEEIINDNKPLIKTIMENTDKNTEPLNKK